MSATVAHLAAQEGTSSTPLSPSRTLTDLQAEKDNDKESSATSLPVNEKVAVPSMAVAEDGKSEDDAAGGNSLSILPPLRKKILLFCFCVAMFIDSAGVGATFVMTDPIAKDLGIGYGNYAWIVGTYSLAFAATLLFSGRLADLYSPSLAYTFGFAGLGIFNLIISFMTNQYAFFILRALRESDGKDSCG